MLTVRGFAVIGVCACGLTLHFNYVFFCFHFYTFWGYCSNSHFGLRRESFAVDFFCNFLDTLLQ